MLIWMKCDPICTTGCCDQKVWAFLVQTDVTVDWGCSPRFGCKKLPSLRQLAFESCDTVQCRLEIILGGFASLHRPLFGRFPFSQLGTNTDEGRGEPDHHHEREAKVRQRRVDHEHHSERDSDRASARRRHIVDVVSNSPTDQPRAGRAPSWRGNG